MPLDITLFREEGGNPELIRESQRRRNAPVEAVDAIIAEDNKWRAAIGKGDNLRKERNAIQKQIATLMKASAMAAKKGETFGQKEECDALLAKKTELDGLIEASEKEQLEMKAKVDKLVNKIGNIVADNVPIGVDEDTCNRVERVWGTPRKEAGLLNHHDLLWRIGKFFHSFFFLLSF